MSELKLPPHNQDAEQGLLGCLLIDNDIYDAIKTNSDHFFMPAHQRIFVEIEAFIANGRKATPITLKNKFVDDPELEEAGGAEYLAELAASVVNLRNAEDYASTLKELWVRRRLIQVANHVSDRAFSYEIMQEGEILADAEKAITELSNDAPNKSFTAVGAVSQSMQWISDVRSGKIIPVKTRYKQLDQILTGLYPANLIILAGRPAMGKTAAMLNLAKNIAQDNNALILSLEMKAQELGMRLIADVAGVNVERQRQAVDLTQEEWEKITEARKKLEAVNLHIQDESRASLSSIISVARKHKRLHGSFTLFIDYLGLIQTDKRIQNKVHQIEEISNSLKALAKELDIAIVLLSQLSREVEKRENKRPILSDLRDSGAIEQDADVIIFPYRAEYYLERDKPEQAVNESDIKFNDRMADWEFQKAKLKGKAEFIVAKNRQGKEGTAYMKFDGERQRFYG